MITEQEMLSVKGAEYHSWDTGWCFTIECKHDTLIMVEYSKFDAGKVWVSLCKEHHSIDLPNIDTIDKLEKLLALLERDN